MRTGRIHAGMGLSREERERIDARVAAIDFTTANPVTVDAAWTDTDPTPSKPSEHPGLTLHAGVDGLDDLHPESTAGHTIHLPETDPWKRGGFDGWRHLGRPVTAIRIPSPTDYGSPQRRRVAAILVATPLVADECRRVIKTDANDRIYEYVAPRITEKILGQSIVSNPNTWNHDNLWDPFNGGSFCGWVRQLSALMAKSAARRVLHPRDRNLSDFERDDGSNPIVEHIPADPIDETTPTAMLIPRPVGRARRTFLTMAHKRHDTAWLTDRLRTRGWWSPDLDRLDPDQAIALMLGPLPRTDRARTAFIDRMGDEDSRTLAALWWDDQTKPPSETRDRRIVDLAGKVARNQHTTRWRLYGMLGAIATGL